MAVVSLQTIVTFSGDEPSLVGRAENAVSSGHIMSFAYDASQYVLVGKVQASMKDKSYDVQIHLSESKAVSSATCNCPRGQLKCHHMVAVLVYANKNISCTDISCQWKVKTKSKDRETVPVSRLFPHPKPHYTATHRPMTDDDRTWAQQELRNLSGTGLHWLTRDDVSSAASVTPVPVVRDVLMSAAYESASDKKDYLRKVFAVSPENAALVETMTRGQRVNELWATLRLGRLTASNFGAVIDAMQRRSFPPSLFRRLLGQYQLSGVKAVQWGVDHEDTAMAAYETNYNVTITAAGLVLHESGLLAASPDGFEADDALLEIKCPYTFRDNTVEEMLNSGKSFIVQNSEGVYVLPHDHAYYHQCQGQLWLTGRSLLHLFVWLPSGSVRLQVDKDEHWAKEHLPKLVQFAIEELLPRYCFQLQS